MAREGGFFSPNRKVTGKDKQIASSMSSGSYGGYIDAGESRGFVSPEQADKMIKNPEAYKMRPSETRYLRESMGLPRAQFFSPSGNEVGQIASATSDLSGLVASSGFTQIDDTSFLDKDDDYKKEMNSIYGEKNYQKLPGFIKKDIKLDYLDRNPIKYKNFQDSSFAPTDTDTKVAMLSGDNLGGYGALGLAGSIFGLGLKGINSAIEGGKRLKENIEQRVNPEKDKVSIGDRVGGFLNKMMGISPVAAVTLDANQMSQESERPKLGYVNPDAKTMSLSQIGEAFKPKNIFGYQDKFGRYDDPGSPLDNQRQETMQRVFNRFTRPVTPDARTIGQIRADQKAEMQEQAKQRYQDFKDRRDLGPAANIQKTFGADDTYGTNVPSNPAMGFRDQMSAVDKARYDKAAKEATAGAQTDSSLGNVMTQTINRVAARFGLPQKNLETVDQRQLRKAQEAYNKPRYQQEAYARRMLGITNDMVKADQRQRMIANAKARNQAFQLQKAIKASERAARRLGGNIGTGRDGGFGTGTEGKGLPSNPKGFSGYSRSRTSTGDGTGPSSGRGRGTTGTTGSKTTSRGTPGARGRGGTGTGKSTQGRGGRRGGSTGGSGASSKGGTGTGGTKTSRKASKASKGRTGRGKSQCDIRTKIDITSLTNQNLIKDDLAKVAYFVQELRGV